jgi:hypothetical protein
MVVSSGFGADGAFGESCRNTPKTCEACGRLQPTPEKLNETGTLVSERVHLREIVVIPGCDGLPDNPGHFA